MTFSPSLTSMSLPILIVEDHILVRTSLRDWLTTLWPQAQFIEVDSGEKAVDVAQAQPLRLIIMDINLPGITGLEATRKIKLEQAQLPIVILSIYESVTYQTHALTAGASAYIPKSQMHTELPNILHQLLSPPIAAPTQ